MCAEHVRYLEFKDLDEYLKSLSQHGTSFVLDPSHLAVFHREMWTKVSGEGLKERKFVEFFLLLYLKLTAHTTSRKHRTLCFIYSHAVAWDDIRCVTALLRSLRHAHYGVELMMMYPSVEKLVADPTQLHALPIEYIELLLETFNPTSKKEICDQYMPFFKTFLAFGKYWALKSESIRSNHIIMRLHQRARLPHVSPASLLEASGISVSFFGPDSKGFSMRLPDRERRRISCEPSLKSLTGDLVLMRNPPFLINRGYGL